MKKEFMLMREIVLGKTGIKVLQNAFGALPIWGIQREEDRKNLITPNLLRKNLADYKDILAGRVQI